MHFLRVINNRTYNLLYKNYIYNRKKFILSMIYFLIRVCGNVVKLQRIRRILSYSSYRRECGRVFNSSDDGNDSRNRRDETNEIPNTARCWVHAIIKSWHVCTSRDCVIANIRSVLTIDRYHRLIRYFKSALFGTDFVYARRNRRLPQLSSHRRQRHA